ESRRSWNRYGERVRYRRRLPGKDGPYAGVQPDQVIILCGVAGPTHDRSHGKSGGIYSMDSDLDHPEQIGPSIRFAKTEKAIVPNLYGADTAVSESPMAVNNLHHVLNIADFRPFNAVAEWA